MGSSFGVWSSNLKSGEGVVGNFERPRQTDEETILISISSSKSVLLFSAAFKYVFTSTSSFLVQTHLCYKKLEP